MKILVTGALGRLGHRLVAHWAGLHQVIGFDRREPDERTWPQACRCVQGNLLDEAALIKAAHDAEVVVHLGAISGRDKQMPPSELFAINVQGTRHVLEAAERCGARLVILATSLCAIGLPDGLDDHALSYLPVDEAHPCRPKHNYDLTKRINEVQAEAFTRRTSIATVCMRFPMLTSVRDSSGFAELLRHDPPKFALVDYLDFSDAVAAIDLAIHRDDLEHELMFFHADSAATRLAIPEYVKHFSPKVEWRGDPDCPFTPLIDASYAKQRLGWSPQIDWREGHATYVQP